MFIKSCQTTKSRFLASFPFLRRFPRFFRGFLVKGLRLKPGHCFLERTCADYMNHESRILIPEIQLSRILRDLFHNLWKTATGVPLLLSPQSMGCPVFTYTHMKKHKINLLNIFYLIGLSQQLGFTPSIIIHHFNRLHGSFAKAFSF